MRRPAALLLDIDGTLAPREGAPAPALEPVLTLARDAGVAVACATARTWPSARLRLARLGWIADEGVFHNGALVVSGGQVAWAAELPAETVAAAVVAARAAAPSVVIAIHHASAAPAFSARLDDRLLAAWGVPAAALRPFDDACRQPAVKLGMWMPGEQPGSIAAAGAAVTAAVGDRTCTMRADADRFVFVTARGVDKAEGARRWLALRGIDPTDAVAAGDDLTDAPLLAMCGHGIAIAGGHPEALAAGSEVVPPPPDDGLARALARFLAVAAS